MAIELHFEKADNTPWGFRLTGGTEFEVPLTVVKVTEDSIAENAGMQVGDLIVRINNVPTAGLTHSEAHDVILGAGNDFVLAIRRGDLSDLLPRLLSESVKQEETVEDDRFNTLEKEESKDSDLNITDEEIATIIGEPVQHHPSPEQSITQSEVLQAVNIESEEKKTPEKKWSTFLQKPRNPVPKPRKVPDDGPKGPAYRVIIKKQPKKSLETSEPLVDIDAKTEESNPKSDQAQLTTEETEEHEESKEQQETADDGLEDKELEASSKEEQEDDNQEKHPGREEEENEDAGSKEEHDSAPESRRDSEARRSSLNLEEQLAQVQKQLLALSRLPSAIQSTLNAVTQQLELIVSASHHEEVIQKEILEASEEEEQIEEEMYVEKALSTLDEEEGEAEERTVEEAVREETAEEHGAYETSSLEEYERHEIEVTEEELEAQREEQERLDKKEKVNHWNHIWPWSDIVKPVYRINFLKYQPPPKNLDHLQRSEVYKIIHDMEPPLKGIVARETKVLAEQDYYAEKQQQSGQLSPQMER